jgi:histidinol phosphatase-like PHP family hydrolase
MRTTSNNAFGTADDVEYLQSLAQANWHIHTIESACAADAMAPRKILAAAKRAGLDSVALVDHHHPGDGPIERKIEQVKKKPGAGRTRVNVVVGAELSAYGIEAFADTLEMNRQVRYRLYACNHYQHPKWEHPRDRSPRGYAEHILAVLRALLPTGRADCIAHPFGNRYLRGLVEDPAEVNRALSDNELHDILLLGKQNGVAWEINTQSCTYDPVFSRRYFRIGREAGVEFRLGTDAHTLEGIDPAPVLPALREALIG